MTYLIDTNLIIRFLVGDHPEHLAIATEIFTKIEQGEYEVEILESVMMEVLFVLTKFYKLPKNDVIDDLKKIEIHLGITLTKIGVITNNQNLKIVGFDKTCQSYQHF